MPKHVLVIAGSDPSGGAGFQADLSTLKDYGVLALSGITALTAQNESRVLQIHPTPADLLTQQLSAACEGKEIDAVKVGMVATHPIVLALVWFLEARKFPNLVIDPILHSSSGTPLLENRAFAPLKQKLLPLARVITPNLPEASAFVGSRIYNEETQKKAAKQIHKEIFSFREGNLKKQPLAVIVKGGHLEKEAIDILYDGVEITAFRAEKIKGPSPRGTGCRFSSSIAAGLALGWPLQKAVQEAKNYLEKYIKGSSIMYHPPLKKGG